MELSLDELISMGKNSMEMIVLTGQFYFPKLAIGRKGVGQIEVAQYDSGFEAFSALMAELITKGPIDWIAHTADTYQFLGGGNEEDDVMTQTQLINGEIRVEDLFEADDPRAVEALSVVLVTAREDQKALLPYRRINAVKVEWLPVPDTIGELHIDPRFVELMRDAVMLSQQFVS